MPDAVNPTLDPLRRKLLLGLGACSALLALPAPLQAAANASDRKLVRWLAGRTGMDATYIGKVLGQAEYKARIIELITTPFESKPYPQYRRAFLTDKLKRMGQDYLQANRQIFAEMQQRYSVEPEVIAAILGMETRYGRHKGKIRVIDSLYTLTTGYPRRAEFFRNELAEFLLMCREEKLDPVTVEGSYAGAFGTTQFIPSSYREYAVDADGDGKRDVWNTPADIIGSVANYFHVHGWTQGRPLAWMLAKHTPALDKQAKLGLTDWKPLAEMRRHLPELDARWHDDDLVSVIELPDGGAGQLALVHYNFYVVTRWNRSYNYAMACAEVAAMLGCKTCAVS